MTASPASGAGCCGRAAADTGDAGAEAASEEASTTTGFRWMAKFRDPAVPEDAGVLSGGAAFRCRHSRSEKKSVSRLSTARSKFRVYDHRVTQYT